MASITGYKELPGGGYLIDKDDGSQIPMSFMPPTLKAQLDAQQQLQPSPEMQAAYEDKGPDMRTADLGGLWNGAKNAASDVARGLGLTSDAAAEIRAREAAKGNYSGIHNTDVAAYEDAKRRGILPEGAAPPPGIAPPPNAARPAGTPAPGEAEMPQGAPAMGGGPRYSFSPGRLVRGGEQKAGEVDSRTEYDPNAQAQLKRGQQNEYEATEAMSAAAEKGGRNTADLLGEIPGTLGAMETARQGAEAKRQAREDRDFEEMDKLRQETREGIHDPDDDKSVGGKLMATVALALGGMGGALLNQPNQVAAKMERETQKLIDIQKTNLNNKRSRLEDAKGMYAQNRMRFSDARQAELATKGAYLEQMQSAVQAQMAEAKTDEDRARGQVVLAGLQKAQAANDMEFSKVTRQIHTHVVPDKVVGGGAIKSEVDPEQYVPEAGGFALRKDAPPEMNERFATNRNMINLLGQIKRAGATFDQRATPENRQVLDSLLGQYAVQFKRAAQIKALNDNTQELAAQVAGDPKSLLGVGREKVLDTLTQNLNANVRSMQHAYGILPGTVQVVVDPTTGQHKAVGLLSGEQLNEGAGGGGGGSGFGFQPMKAP